MSNKLPSFQFYPGDWRKDPAVQALTYHDRGVWLELMCLMHETEPRGKLALGGKPYPPHILARALGLILDHGAVGLQQTIDRLLDYGVASKDEDGFIFSRRMVRDEYIRQVRAEAGKKGAKYGPQGGRPARSTKPAKTAKTAKKTAKQPRKGF